MRKDSDPNAAMTILVGISGAVVLFVIVVLLQAFFYRSEEAEQRKKVVNVQAETLADVRAQQQEVLNGYRWVDQQRGVVAIPIDRAMELMIRDSGRSREAPADS